MKDPLDIKIAILGLGYVGLPLALKFGVRFETIGVDLSNEKISAYKRNVDPSGELSEKDFLQATKLTYTTNIKQISTADLVIICVPTPITSKNEPDLESLITATKSVGELLKPGMIVVFESTVYPGLTEEICIPILEKSSKLVWKRDFNIGYSPERINPGDKNRTLSKIVKVVSGDTEKTLKKLNKVYSTIIEAGVYNAPSIKVAEAAKVIENTQRDLNIALMNELSIVFKKLNINTNEVLAAANTKWNFLPFKPGLVGGHCIGIDPYYITHKAKALGYEPEVILAGRKINDEMHQYLCDEILKKLMENGYKINEVKICIFGITFKKNCADIRNTGVAKLIRELRKNSVNVVVNDPLASPKECKDLYNVKLTKIPKNEKFDCLIFAVDHDYYRNLPPQSLLTHLRKGGLVFDLNLFIPPEEYKEANINFWQL